MKVKLSNEEIRKHLESPSREFPKYTTQLINLANRNAQGTRPKVVGQLSDLIQEFPGKRLAEWERWYLNKYPEAIAVATQKIVEMLQNLKKALSSIDQKLVEDWVRDLVIVKTFIGLRFQEAILKKVAEVRGCSYRLAAPAEESQGIDGFLDDKPVSIKPSTYKNMPSLREEIQVDLIYYSKVKNGLVIEFDG